MYNFKDAKEPAQSAFLTHPGYYLAKIVETKFVEPVDKTPYIIVKFETTSGASVEERFFISGAALWRLGVLYQAVWNDELDQDFATAKAVADFFSTALKKNKQVGIRVEGEKYNGKVYCNKLPFREFVFGDLTKFKEREVLDTDEDYSTWIREQRAEQAPAASTVLPKEEKKTDWDSIGSKDTSDDLPF